MTSQKYRLREVTPKADRCLIGSCPGVYELKNITPEGEKCGIGACPAIYETGIGGLATNPVRQPRQKGKRVIVYHQGEKVLTVQEMQGAYFVVGQVVNPSDFGLEGKVGKTEALVMIPKRVVDRK